MQGADDQARAASTSCVNGRNLKFDLPQSSGNGSPSSSEGFAIGYRGRLRKGHGYADVYALRPPQAIDCFLAASSFEGVWPGRQAEQGELISFANPAQAPFASTYSRSEIPQRPLRPGIPTFSFLNIARQKMSGACRLFLQQVARVQVEGRTATSQVQIDRTIIETGKVLQLRVASSFQASSASLGAYFALLACRKGQSSCMKTSPKLGQIWEAQMASWRLCKSGLLMVPR